MKNLLTILVLLGCLSAHARADFNGIDLSTMCVSNNPAIRDQGDGRVAQPFGFRPHRSGHADFPHPALPKDNLRHAARTVQG